MAISDGLITIGAHGTLFENNLVKSELEDFGVDALLENTNMIGVYWLWSNLLGGLKVRVVRSAILESATHPADRSRRSGGRPGNAGDRQAL